MTTSLAPFRLKPWFSERVWGRKDLRPWYEETGTAEPVGEAWLTGPASVVEEGELAGQTLASVVEQHREELLGTGSISDGAAEEFPLLVKLLFPSDKLSVQVHPDDEEAKTLLGQPRGKTECWYVLEAEPGATVALGLRPGVTLDALKASALPGAEPNMEALLEQVPVAKGDMIFVDAGTIHAIGPGVVLLETQQTSDVTFRMYDYGRPRELHLEQGLGVTKLRTGAGKVAPREMDGFVRLIEERYFVVDRFDLERMEEQRVEMIGPGCLVGLSGSVWIITPGEEIELLPGQAVVVPASLGEVIVEAERGAAFLRCVAPAV